MSGILFLVLERENFFIRFHALQSVIVFGGLFVVDVGLRVIPFLGRLLDPIFNLISILLWILLIVKAFSGERYKLPYVGELVERGLGRI